MMNAIALLSIHYWGQSWRLKAWDFQTRTETIKRYGVGAIPKGSTLEDWPLTYDELEPFYDLIEYEIGVSGKAGNIRGTLDPAGNVYEAPRQREYPMPHLREAGLPDAMFDTAKSSVEAVSLPHGDRSEHPSPRTPRLRLSRLLRHGRVPPQRQELDRDHYHS